MSRSTDSERRARCCPALRLGGGTMIPAPRGVHTFSSFGVGPSNRVAWAECLAWAGRRPPGRLLVVAGPPGSGKTHLLEATANRWLEARPGARVGALCGADYLSLLRRAPGAGAREGLAGELSCLGLLLLDDLEVLWGRPEALGELRRTLERLMGRGGSAALACAGRAPGTPPAARAVTSRAPGAFVVFLEKPDVETRAEILKAVVRSHREHLPDDVAAAMAERLEPHGRVLAAVAVRLVALACTAGRAADMELARKALEEWGAKS